MNSDGDSVGIRCHLPVLDFDVCAVFEPLRVKRQWMIRLDGSVASANIVETIVTDNEESVWCSAFDRPTDARVTTLVLLCKSAEARTSIGMRELKAEDKGMLVTLVPVVEAPARNAIQPLTLTHMPVNSSSYM